MTTPTPSTPTPKPRFYYYPTRVNDKLVHFIMDRETGRPVDVLRARTLARPRVETLNTRLFVAEALWSRREGAPKAAPTAGQLAYEAYRQTTPSYLNGYRRWLWSDLTPAIQNIWEDVISRSKTSGSTS